MHVTKCIYYIEYYKMLDSIVFPSFSIICAYEGKLLVGHWQSTATQKRLKGTLMPTLHAVAPAAFVCTLEFRWGATYFHGRQNLSPKVPSVCHTTVYC